MPIVVVILLLALFGFLLWLVNTQIPMHQTVKLIINIVAVVAIVVWLLRVFGLLHWVMDPRV